MAGIFISYRRDDAKHAAGRLVERLGRSFAPGQLFFDIDNIEPGLDFKKVLSEKVQSCDVLLAVIGPDWLDARNEHGARRLDDPRDFVRVEIEAALARDVRVIPVLVDGARMPNEDELPEAIRSLSFRNGVRMAHERFASDADGLTQALAKIVAAKAPIKVPYQSAEKQSTQPGRSYLMWAGVSVCTAAVTAFLGYGGIAGPAMEAARLVFWIAVAGFLVAGILHRRLSKQKP